MHLTWTEKPLNELLRLAWPITVSVLSYAVMTMTDTLFVGQLGPAALAGVGLAGTACFATLGFALGLLRATKVVVSQEYGAGRHQELGAHINSGLALALVLGIAASALSFSMPIHGAIAHASAATAIPRNRARASPLLI
ncbi:MAG: MATE family efflux transporter [Myxococcota bacterium]